jgi:hypothetical protein
MGDSLGDLWWVFVLFFVAKVVWPVRVFECFVWQMYGASPFALRRREIVRHAAAGRPFVALARASLWLLLACDFVPVSVVFAVLFWVYRCCEVYADLFL